MSETLRTVRCQLIPQASAQHTLPSESARQSITEWSTEPETRMPLNCSFSAPDEAKRVSNQRTQFTRPATITRMTGYCRYQTGMAMKRCKDGLTIINSHLSVMN